jgi:acetyl esterase
MNTPPSTPGSLPAGTADDVFEWQGASGLLSLRLYTAGPRKSEALMVFLPPGGFVMADLDAADCCLKEFAQDCGVTILAPSYAVAPEHPFPAAIEDAHTVLRLAAARGGRLRGWTGRHLIVGGIEAGGNLAAVGALMSRDRIGPKLAGQVLLMPMLDPSMRQVACTPFVPLPAAMADAFRDYLPRAADRVHPYACPLESSRLAGLPPALIVYADGDPLAAGAIAYADKLQQAGVPVHRTALPASVLDGVAERCEAAGSDLCADAVKTFLAPFTAAPRPHPTQSVASALHQKTPEAPHD